MDMKLMAQIRVVIVLILGMLALGLLTWGIGKIYLELVGQSSRGQSSVVQSGQKDTDDNNLVLVLPKVTFWTCQIGVFENEMNARKSKEQLMQLGFKAEVINSNTWFVGIGLGNSASELKGLRSSLAANGIPTIPKQIELPERTFRVAGSGAQLTVDLLTNVNDILKGEVITEALVKESQLWNAQAGNRPPKGLEQLHYDFSLIREKSTPEEQRALGLSLFNESQRVIKLLSGK